MSEEGKVIWLGSLYGLGTGFAGNVYDINGIAPTLGTMQGGGREPSILIEGTRNDRQDNNIGTVE